MATNDDYRQYPPPTQPSAYRGGDSSSVFSAAPPSYHTQNAAADYRPSKHTTTGPSPFDTVFDDHVYPASTYKTPASSQHRLNDIPLQDHNARKSPTDPEMQDHVYDAPQRTRSNKGRVRFGELGMFGADSKRIPWVVYFFTLVQVGVFIAEIVKNGIATGSPIMIKPQFNPMIGPSPYILINMGARFVACMHNTPGIQNANDTIWWPCPNTTTLDREDPTQKCTLSDLCGFGGVAEPFYNATATMDQKPEPNQWFRFITPMFLHAGLIHIGFNLLLQLTMGRDMERSIGSIRFFLVYVSAGIFGFVMGGNFAASGIASTGASGSLFGVIALTLLDLLYSWKDRRSPVKDLLFILLDIAISFVLGLLPGLDNFSHIGGFLMGLALGICVLHSPNSLRLRIGGDAPPYSHVDATTGAAYVAGGEGPSFVKNPVGFFKGRKPLWWAWWLIRAGALVLVLVVFILLLNNFYIYHKTCSWCKYLSCLNVNNWCETGNLLITANQTTLNKRDLFPDGWAGMARLHGF